MSDDFDPATIAHVLDDEALFRCTRALSQADEIVIDLETTGLNDHHPDARIVLAQFTLPRGSPHPTTWVVPLSHPDGPNRHRWRRVMHALALTVATADGAVIGQNVKFDCRWIYSHTRVDLSGRIAWDTKAAAHLMDENESTSLKRVVPRVFGIDRWDEDVDFSSGFGAAERTPYFDLALYGARDTYWTWRLAVWQREALGVTAGIDPRDPEAALTKGLRSLALWLVMPMVGSLTSIEQNGMRLDTDWVEAGIRESERIVTEETKWLTARDPGIEDVAEDEGFTESYAPTSLWWRAYSERAIDRGDLEIMDTTPNGNPSWTARVLRRHVQKGYEIAEHLLRLRDYEKRAQYLRSWLDHLAQDGRVHADYNITSTITGRLSSSEPNMQQVSKEIRPAWIASDGKLLAEIDYSQIELRVGAYIAPCPPMKAAFQQDRDVHREMAARLADKPAADVTDGERYRAKAANFGLLYGMSPYGFMLYAEDAYGLEIDEAEATRIHATYFDTWAGLREWHRRSVEQARRRGYVVSPIGRVRRLPEVRSPVDGVREHAERQAINAPVQSMASDLMQLAAARIGGYLPGEDPVEGVRAVATVHDSIVVEIPEDGWKEALSETMRRMIDLSDLLACLGVTDFDVPLKVEAEVGERWGRPEIVVVS